MIDCPACARAQDTVVASAVLTRTGTIYRATCETCDVEFIVSIELG